MNRSHLLFLAALCAGGLLIGRVSHRSFSGRTHGVISKESTASPHGQAVGISSNPSDPQSKPPLPEIPHARSADTAETLLAADPATSYARIAAWIIDASKDDIAAYWAGYQKGQRTNDVTDLVFINWTRLDPQAAIAAVAGTGDEHYAWWAWAANDPKTALAKAIATHPDRVNDVAGGIGEFNPQWLRDHFDQIPEAARGDALRCLAKWQDGANPLEALKFMKDHQMAFDAGTFKALVNQDPWAAFDWIKANPSLQKNRYGGDTEPMDILLSTMSREHPDDLARLAAQTPPGKLRRKMEATLFDNLLATDPAAALENAKATDVPLLAAERYAKIGMSLVATDPAKAFEMAQALFKASPGALEAQIRIDYPNGSAWWGSPPGSAPEFLDSLLTKEPAKVLDLFTTSGAGKSGSNETFSNLSQKWATQDLVGYTNWVNEQTDPKIRESATSIVVDQLTNGGQFTEALEWGMSSEEGRNGVGLSNIFYQWGKSDPTAAAAWLDTADLPEQQKSRYRSIIKGQSQSN